NKALPVIGIWSLANTDVPAPLSTPGVFNSFITGMTRLDVNLLSTTDFRIGIADSRGDGRPDFRYRARIFYGDSIVPLRASAQGGTSIAVKGLGFRPNTKAVVNGANTTVVNVSAGQVLLTTPPAADGRRNITLNDSATGASSVMTDAII